MTLCGYPLQEEGKETVVRTEQRCDLIMLMEKIPGQLEITNKHIYFYPEQQERRESQLCEYSHTHSHLTNSKGVRFSKSV